MQRRDGLSTHLLCDALCIRMDGCVERPYSPGRGTITTRAAADEPPCICMLAPCRPACPSTEGRTSRAVFFFTRLRARTHTHPLITHARKTQSYGGEPARCSAAQQPAWTARILRRHLRPHVRIAQQSGVLRVGLLKMGLSSRSPNLDSPTRAYNSQIALCIQETHPSTQSDTPHGLVPSLRRSPSLWSLWRPGAARCPDPTVQCLVPSLSGQCAALHLCRPVLRSHHAQLDGCCFCCHSRSHLVSEFRQYLLPNLGIGRGGSAFAAGWLPYLGILTHHLSCYHERHSLETLLACLLSAPGGGIIWRFCMPVLRLRHVDPLPGGQTSSASKPRLAPTMRLLLARASKPSLRIRCLGTSTFSTFLGPEVRIILSPMCFAGD
jgi:hypothetical protein